MATVTMDGVDAAVGLVVGSAEAVVRLEQFVEHVVGVRAARFPSRTAHASWKDALPSSPPTQGRASPCLLRARCDAFLPRRTSWCGAWPSHPLIPQRGIHGSLEDLLDGSLHGRLDGRHELDFPIHGVGSEGCLRFWRFVEFAWMERLAMILDC
jgi:hypothetical protein